MARWTSVDPKAEIEQVSTTPYGYVYDNPVKNTDPDGREANDITVKGLGNSSITIQTDVVNTTINAPIDFHGNYTINGEAGLQVGLDLVSIVDPTPVTTVLSAGISAKNGDVFGAALSIAGVVPGFGKLAEVAKIEKDLATIEKIATDVTKVEEKVALTLEKDAQALSKQGRMGRQARLKELAENDKLGKADRGWLKQEKNEINAGKRTSMRNPPGKELAH